MTNIANAIASKPQSFVGAMRSYFGFGDGGNLQSFQRELKALTPEDKMYFHRELNKAGVNCEAPTSAAVAA